jgi:hypothetical protein
MPSICSLTGEGVVIFFLRKKKRIKERRERA